MVIVRDRLAYTMLALAVLFSSPVHAQVSGATLTGTVMDQSGAVIANAKLSITNKATDVTREVTTDTSGLYSAPNLQPGIYDITVEAPGFSTSVQTGLTLTVGATQALNISLQIGKKVEHSDVSGITPDVQLTTSEMSAEVDSTTVRELPLNGRDWTQLATLQPGVTSVRVEAGPGNRGNRGYGTLLSVSGHQPYENNYRINGISINDYSNGSPGSTLGVNLGVDAIQEFSVLLGNYPAEYGRASGGVINAITKSGTNGFHGAAYWFIREKGLDARNYFDKTLPPFHRNQFGASGGGAIIKNKTFVFADFEGIRQDKSDTFTNVVPSAAARGISPSGQPTVAMIGGVPLPGPGQPGAAPNPDPVTHIDKAVIPYLGFFPLPNGGLIGNGDTGNFNTSGIERLTENYVTARVDHHFSDKDSLDGSYFFDNAPLTTPDSLVDVLNENFTRRQMFGLEETHIFSPSLVNTARLGFSRVRALVTAPLSALNPLAKDTSLGALPGRYAPALNIPGVVQMLGALGSISSDILTWNSYQFYDDAFLTRGSHSIKFGFAFERMQNDEFSGGVPPNGQFNFPSLQGFLLNQPTSVNLDDPSTTRTMSVRQSLFGGYIQDDWRFRPNLMLNIGLRYEPTTLPTEANNRFAVLTTLTSPAETPVKTFWAQNQTLHNFQPRVGLAWDPFGNGKTAVRAAFGIYDELPLPWVFSHNNTGVLPYALEKDGYNLPAGSFPTGAVALVNVPNSSTVGNRYLQQEPKRNYTMNWNLNIQRELAGNVTAAVAYVGSHTLHSPFSTDDSNMVLPTLTSAGYLWPCDPSLATATTPCTGGGVRLNPNVGRIRATWWDNNATYEGLQAGVAKRMSHGIQAQGSYTWSKCIDMGSGGMLGDPYANSLSSLMFFNKGGRRGLCDYNIAHNFVLNYLWQVPKPTFGGGVVGHLLGGWELGGILVASTGSPFTLTIGGDPLGQLSTDPKSFVSRVSGPGCGGNPVNSGNVNNYIKLSCFTDPMVPASFTGGPCQLASNGQGGTIPGTCMNLFGNNGRNTVTGPGLINVDFSVFKNNYIETSAGTINVQLRGEFFNVINHTNFQSPIANSALFNQDGSPVSGAGAINSTSTTNRQIQIGLKVTF